MCAQRIACTGNSLLRSRKGRFRIRSAGAPAPSVGPRRRTASVGAALAGKPQVAASCTATTCVLQAPTSFRSVSPSFGKSTSAPSSMRTWERSSSELASSVLFQEQAVRNSCSLPTRAAASPRRASSSGQKCLGALLHADRVPLTGDELPGVQHQHRGALAVPLFVDGRDLVEHRVRREDAARRQVREVVVALVAPARRCPDQKTTPW